MVRKKDKNAYRFSDSTATFALTRGFLSPGREPNCLTLTQN